MLSECKLGAPGNGVKQQAVHSRLAGVPTKESPSRTARQDARALTMRDVRDLVPWLWADVDLNLSRGRYQSLRASGNRPPLAPTVTSSVSLTVRDGDPIGGGVRQRFIGSQPASEDASILARRSGIWELFAVWHRGPPEIDLAVLNLFTNWNEAQFATTSRPRGEPSESTESHFTSGTSFATQFGPSWRL